MMVANSLPDAMMLSELLVDLVDKEKIPDVRVSGVTADSRKVRPGDLFLAVSGLQVHGLVHVQQALDQGAIAIAWEPAEGVSLPRVAVPTIAVSNLNRNLGQIADRFYASPSKDMFSIGVTGTDGKTSVTHFIAQALSMNDAPCGLLGTLGYGVFGKLQQSSHTTPDAVRLQAELARLLDQGVERFTMEVSSHALHQQRTDGVAFDVAVLTQLSRDHLDYHGSIEAYAQAKQRLFLTPGLSCAVLNTNDSFGRQLTAQLSDKIRLISYAVLPDDESHRADEWIEVVEVKALRNGLRLKLESSFGTAVLDSGLLGLFNAENLCAALGALLAAGIGFDDAVERLSAVQTVAGRMEMFTREGAPRVVVDYAHTPNALENALQALRQHCTGKLTVVFGAGGERDTGKRPLMGAVAQRNSDSVIVTSDNPRSEDPEKIIDQIVLGADQPENILKIEDRAEAIKAAIDSASDEDLVLVAGKGHEEYQQLRSGRFPFSDRALIQELLRRAAR